MCGWVCEGVGEGVSVSVSMGSVQLVAVSVQLADCKVAVHELCGVCRQLEIVSPGAHVVVCPRF